MATTTTPVWSDNVSVTASASLSLNAVSRATHDARSKLGVRYFLRIGRTGTTALTTGIVAIVRPTINNAGIINPALYFSQVSLIAAANSTTISGANVAAGDTTLNVASTTGFTAGDFIIVGQGTAREEWCRVARVTDATHLLIDAPCQFAHTTAQADTVINKCDTWVAEVPGGATYEIIFDYGASTTGNSVRVQCLAQTYDSLSNA